MRYMHGNNNFLIPSRFINEIDEGLLESIKITHTKNFKNKPLPNEDDIYSQENSFESFSQEEEYSFIKIGGRVSHMKFGYGVILRYTGKGDALKLTINFDDYGKKELVLSYAHLKFLN